MKQTEGKSLMVPIQCPLEHAKAITAFIQRFGTRVN